MRRLSATWIAITLVAWTGIVLADGDHVARQDAPRGQPRSIRHALGATHVDGKYSLTEKTFLIEGAEQIADLGCQVIKLYLMVPPDKYPFHTQWPAAGSLVALARTAPYRSVFASSFTTFVLTAYATGRPDHYWRRGVTNEQADDETEQFYRLTHHLLTEYRGSGKTFVLQHWDTQDDPVRLRRALDSIAAHTPDREPFGDRNVYIGEFGVPENERSEADVRRIVSGVTDVACEWGCPYVIFWQVLHERLKQP